MKIVFCYLPFSINSVSWPDEPWRVHFDSFGVSLVLLMITFLKKKKVHKVNVLHQLDITRLDVLVAYIIREVK